MPRLMRGASYCREGESLMEKRFTRLMSKEGEEEVRTNDPNEQERWLRHLLKMIHGSVPNQELLR